MHTIVKEIFKLAVCIKPRLIRQGFQMMDTLNATQDTFEQMNRLLDQGKLKGNLFAASCKILKWLTIIRPY